MAKSKVYFYRFIHTEEKVCLKWRLDIKFYPRIRHRRPIRQIYQIESVQTIECELILF